MSRITYINDKEKQEDFKLYDPNNTFIPSNSIFKEPQDTNLSIRDRALKFFDRVIGNDPIKENLYRALLKEDRIINILIIGAPATSKSLLMKCIEDQCEGVLYYDSSAGSTGAGLIEILRRNQNAKILIIDELSEMKGGNLDVMRSLLNDGRVSKTLKSQLINFKMRGLKVFATSNNPTKLSLPLKSRFQIYLINSYTDDEFREVLKFCLLKQNIIDNEHLATELGFAMGRYGVKNIRTAISICSLIDSKNDSIPDIKRIIENYLIFNGAECNINFNQQEG